MAGQQTLTEPVYLAIMQAVRDGLPVTAACDAAKVSREAFYRLLERSPEAKAAYAQARAEWEAELVAGIQATARDFEHRDSFKAKAFMLTHWPSTRETYYENRRSIVEHQAIDHNVAQLHTTVRELGSDELLALGSALEAVDEVESESLGSEQ